MSKHGFKNSMTVMMALVLTALAVSSSIVKAATLETISGLHVTIHSTEDILARWLVQRDGRTYLEHPAVGTVELENEAYPWSGLVPVDAAVVEEALVSMQGFHSDIAVDVFLLPGFPAGILSSFARNDVIFLAPGLARQSDEAVAYVATHEMGHVLCWAAVDGRPERWDAYRRLRGLDPAGLDGADVPHAWRHREIIAEDMRFLFGGPLATANGTIENRELPTPDAIDGLTDLLVGYLAEPGGTVVADMPSRAYPNPCRDLARIELDLGDTAAKSGGIASPTLEIYDVRGRLVRRVTDGRVTAGRACVTWDGTGRDGHRAADGVYLYRITSGSRSGRGRVVLVAR